MTNELETINGYLEWTDSDIDKSPEAYVRHLEDEQNRQLLPDILETVDRALKWVSKGETEEAINTLEYLGTLLPGSKVEF